MSTEGSDQTVNQETVGRVRASFQRCLADSSEFFDDFYFRLPEQIPQVGALFAMVDMAAQNELIRRGVADLIDFSDGSPLAAAELRRLGQTHGPDGLKIPIEWYPQWISTMLTTIRDHDPQIDDQGLDAWRTVLEYGVAEMTSASHASDGQK